MYKEIAPFEMVGRYLHFTKKAISFFVFVEKVFRIPHKQRSVRGASTQVPTLMLLQNKELSQAAIHGFWDSLIWICRADQYGSVYV
ncbi:hypothetical protein GC101_17975 [Paenibacillus sp. LMG 31459]|uniref:Transposase n=1 Tax=Paenibacillus phytohabitans TaxID=2654978 RepID=A0ABX1YIA9_9BACL|nr:hypothetical protein [Paenibacillus phytohabitans]